MASTDRESLIKSCAAGPLDELPRLVLADWMDEHGEDSFRLRWWAEWRPILHELPPSRVTHNHHYLAMSAASKLYLSSWWVYVLAVVTACRLAMDVIATYTSSKKVSIARPAVHVLLHAAEMLALGVWSPGRYDNQASSAVRAINSRHWSSRVGAVLRMIGDVAVTALDESREINMCRALQFASQWKSVGGWAGWYGSAVDLADRFREAADSIPDELR